jgi:flagellar biosynthesis/type III secretory pathway protein FliH
MTSSTKEAAIESAIREWHSQPEDIPSNEQRAIKHGVEVGYDAGYESARSSWTAIVQEIEDAFEEYVDERPDDEQGTTTEWNRFRKVEKRMNRALETARREGHQQGGE